MKSDLGKLCKPGYCFGKGGRQANSKNVCKQWQIELREKFNLN